ncbi:MAG: nucleoside-diphosphate kinase [Nitrospirae bacterium]|nr:nucleoside-diphosphate kinase [Nitrospirota bacterium]
MQRTLSIVKPDAVKKNLIGKIIGRFEKAGLRVSALRMFRITKETAKRFYIAHKDKPFYESLTDFISEGPIVVMVLEGKDAISKVRDIMGATNPKDAKKGTLRADFAESIDRNIVHGSDSLESAKYEIPFFFSAIEIME